MRLGDVCLLQRWFGRVQGVLVLGVGPADRRIDRSSQAALPEASVMAVPQTSGESFQKENVWMGSLHHADPVCRDRKRGAALNEFYMHTANLGCMVWRSWGEDCQISLKANALDLRFKQRGSYWFAGRSSGRDTVGLYCTVHKYR